MRWFVVTLTLGLLLACDQREEPEPSTVSEMVDRSAEKNTITVTAAAAKQIGEMAKQVLGEGDFVVQIAAARGGSGMFDYDFQVLREAPKETVFAESSGLKIVIPKTSVALIEGAKLDYRPHGKESGFRFENPNEIIEHDYGTLPDDPAYQSAATRKREPYSNIYPKDYVGPEACVECHEQQYTRWRAHPHSKMNANVSETTVVGDFSGTAIEYAGGKTVFSNEDGQFIMAINYPGHPARRYRVTRTVGSRVFQMYIGVQTDGPEPQGDPIYDEERKLPFAYSIYRGEWFPETYDEPQYVPEYDADGNLTKEHAYQTRNFRPVWEQSCLWCHNTYPYHARMQKRMLGFPPSHLSLEKVLFPIEHRDSLRTHSFPHEELVTLGISCESCHFGGREHIQEKREIRFLPDGEHLTFAKATPQLIDQARESPYVMNAICAQCHSAPQPKYPNLASTWNSSESLDMQGGSCATEVRCVDCHNPHRALPPANPEGMERLSLKSVQSCVRCHEPYKDPKAAAAHSKHPVSSKVTCLDCHMPKIVHGRADMVRSHHISSPTDPRMLAQAAPNACNLCHLDKSISWTLTELQKGWNAKLEPNDFWLKSYGGRLDRPMGTAWLHHPSPAVRKAAATALSYSPLGNAAVRLVARTLNDRVPSNRLFGRLALERIIGRKIATNTYQPWASPEARAKQIEAILKWLETQESK